MKYVARNQHEVGTELDRLVDRSLERRRNISLALVDSRRRQALILPVSNVQIREMNKTHGAQFPTSARSDCVTRMRACMAGFPSG